MTLPLWGLAGLYLTMIIVSVLTFKDMVKYDFKNSSGPWFALTIVNGIAILCYFLYLVSYKLI